MAPRACMLAFGVVVRAVVAVAAPAAGASMAGAAVALSAPAPAHARARLRAADGLARHGAQLPPPQALTPQVPRSYIKTLKRTSCARLRAVHATMLTCRPGR